MEANYLSALLDELVPSAREYGKEHLSILGVILGMIVFASLNSLLREPPGS